MQFLLDAIDFVIVRSVLRIEFFLDLREFAMELSHHCLCFLNLGTVLRFFEVFLDQVIPPATPLNILFEHRDVTASFLANAENFSMIRLLVSIPLLVQNSAQAKLSPSNEVLAVTNN